MTAAADSQTRDAVRKIHRANPAARIIVTGCYAQRAPDEIAALEGVTWVIGNSHQTEIPKIAAGLIVETAEGIFRSSTCHSERFRADLVARRRPNVSCARPGENSDRRHLRADFRASRACRNWRRRPHAASPENSGWLQQPLLLLRDSVRSRTQPQPVACCGGRRSAKACRGGSREIVLSGINLGAYGRDLTPRASLFDVIHRILGETDLEQLRLSSIEPQDVTEELISLIAGSPRLAPHFHVPLQSGSDRILRAMHRWYRAGHYAERVERIRQISPDAAIGADVIVGFPGETDEDFQATFELIEHLPFTYLHVFSFSARPAQKGQSLEKPFRQPSFANALVPCAHSRRKKSCEFRATQAGRVLRALTLVGGDDTLDPGIDCELSEGSNPWPGARQRMAGSVSPFRRDLDGRLRGR